MSLFIITSSNTHFTLEKMRKGYSCLAFIICELSILM
jgi:hypothetical protein